MNGKTSAPAGATPSKFDDFKLVQDIAVNVSVEIDQMKVSVQKLYDLTSDSILTSAKPAGEPIDICVNGYGVARGEIIALGSTVGVRITEIIGQGPRKPGARA